MNRELRDAILALCDRIDDEFDIANESIEIPAEIITLRNALSNSL